MAETGYILRINTSSGRVGISKHYKTVRGGIKYFAKPFAKGEQCTVEVFHDARLLHLSSPWVLKFDSSFKRIEEV